MAFKSTEEEFPLVTIITPTYNSNPQYLKETIDSVLMQTYPKIEYIITDDGSKEFPEEDIRKYLAENARENVEWKIIRNLENVGTVKNMNGAIRASHGEYIFGCAHDDSYYDERVIEEWVREFQRRGAMVVTALMSIRGEGNNTEIFVPNGKEKEWLKTLTPKELHKKLMRGNFICAPSTAYSRHCIDEYNLYDEQYRVLEDYPTYLKLSFHDVEYHFWERAVIKYRMGDGISTSKIWRNLYYDIDNLTLEKDMWKLSKGFQKMRHTINACMLSYQITRVKKISFEISYNYRYILLHSPILLVLTLIVRLFQKIIDSVTNLLYIKYIRKKDGSTKFDFR